MHLHKQFFLVHAGKCYAAPQLHNILDSLCWRLHDAGLRPGMVLCSVLEQRWLNTLLLFAVPRMGCVFFPLDPDLPSSHQDQLLAAAQVDMLVQEDAFFAEVGCPDRSFPEAKLDRNAVCLLVASSGTGGSPRVVEFTCNNLLSSAAASEQHLQTNTKSVWMACLPLFHIGGLSILLRGAFSGFGVVLEERFVPALLQQKMVSNGVSHLSLVPTMLAKLLSQKGECKPPSTLRAVLLGGAAADEVLVNCGLQQGWPICPSYGMTETASQVATCFPVPDKWIGGMVGKPLPHAEIGIDEDGCVRIRGTSVARYARQSDGRRQLLVDAEGWLHTRDVGWFDQQAGLYIDGRLDDVLISGGENIQPQMLEQILGRCPGIEDVAIGAIADTLWGEKLVVLYSGAIPVERVREWAKLHLQKAFLPKQFFKLESLPRNAMGKLLRTEVRRIALDLSQLKSSLR